MTEPKFVEVPLDNLDSILLSSTTPHPPSHSTTVRSIQSTVKSTSDRPLSTVNSEVNQAVESSTKPEENRFSRPRPNLFNRNRNSLFTKNREKADKSGSTSGDETPPRRLFTPPRSGFNPVTGSGEEDTETSSRPNRFKIPPR